MALAVSNHYSYRAVIRAVGLIPAGGNYAQVQRRINQLKLDTSHFKGMGWNKGVSYHTSVRPVLKDLLVKHREVQSYKLKARLFEEKLKKPMCELCGWSQKALDGRIPVELDHINGDRFDNRLENLRILCPNCHSLQATHRGKNKKRGLIRLG